MNDLEELYQEVVLDHSRAPRNFGTLGKDAISSRGANPSCGDHLALQMRVEAGKVAQVRFCGDGCAISRASASLMTEAVQDLSVDEARELFGRVHRLLTTGEAGCPAEALGKLFVLAGVWQYPSRVKCATLPWHTLRSALDQAEQTR